MKQKSTNQRINTSPHQSTALKTNPSLLAKVILEQLRTIYEFISTKFLEWQPCPFLFGLVTVCHVTNIEMSHPNFLYTFRLAY